MNDAAVVEPDEEIESDEVETETEEIETEEIDEDEASQDDESEDEPSESSTEKKDSFQERIDELTAKYRSEERARRMAEERARAIEQEAEQLRQQQPRQAARPDKTLSDFDYDEGKYSEYLLNFAQERARADAMESARQEQARERTTRLRAEFSLREADFSKKVSDYRDVVYRDDLPITQEIAEVIQSAEKGPDVAYYLAKNPDVLSRLADMHPYDMAREIGRIEASQLVIPEKKPETPPKPPPKIKSGDGARKIASDDPASDKLSDAEWLAREKKRLGYNG